jgi:hypothetical protein
MGSRGHDSSAFGPIRRPFRVEIQAVRTLTIAVQSHEQFAADSIEAARRIDAAGGYQGEVYSFETISLLFELFTVNRWQMSPPCSKLVRRA